MTEADDVFKKFSGYSIIQKIKQNSSTDLYKLTEYAQSALLILQISIIKFLKSYGFKYNAVIGHSVGEIAAAWASGSLSLEDAMRLVHTRSKAQELTKGKGLLAVIALGDNETSILMNKLRLETLIEIAGINSPKLTTVSGRERDLLKLQEYAENKEIYFKFLDVDYPFHSKMMDEIKDIFADEIKGQIHSVESEIPFVSTVYGKFHEGNKLDPLYWWNNLRQPVKFQQGIQSLLQEGYTTFIEVGAHPILLRSISQCNAANNLEINLIPTLQKETNDVFELNNLVFKLLASGLGIDGARWFGDQFQKLDLPSYCWDRKKITRPQTIETLNAISFPIEHPLLGWRLPGSEIVWENHIDATNCMDIKDHVLGQSIIFPAAAFIEMAIAAYSHISDSEIGSIDDFQLISPLLLDYDITLSLRFEVNDYGYFFIKSKPRLSDIAWTIHAKGRLFKKSRFLNVKQCEIDKNQNIPPVSVVSAKKLYDLASDIDLNYGDEFQNAGNIEVYHDRCFSSISQGDSARYNYFYGPGLIDSGLHSVIPLINYRLNYELHLYLPSSCESIVFRNNNQCSITSSSIKLHSISLSALKMDVLLFNSDGEPILSLKSFRANRTDILAQNSGLPDLCEYKPLFFQQLKYNPDDLNNKIRKELCSLESSKSEALTEANSILEALSISYLAYGAKTLFPNDFKSIMRYPEEKFSRLHWALRFLAQEEYLNKDEQFAYKWNQDKEIVKPEDIMNLVIEKYSLFLPEALYINRIGRRMDDFLIGKTKVDEIYCPKGGVYYTLFHESEFIRFSASIISNCYTKILNGLKPNQKLNILEIGSGMFVDVLTNMTNDSFDLISYNLLTFDESLIKNKAYKKINADLRLIDINEDFSTQDFKQKFDIVFCADLNSLLNKKEFLSFVNEMLADKGTLIFTENQPSVHQFLLDVQKPYNIRRFLEDSRKPEFYSAKFWHKAIDTVGLKIEKNIMLSPDSDFGRFISVFLKDGKHDCDMNSETQRSLVKSTQSILMLYSEESDMTAQIKNKINSFYNAPVFLNYKSERYLNYVYSDFDQILFCPDKNIPIEDTSADLTLMNIAKNIFSENPGRARPVISLIVSGGALCNDRRGLKVDNRNPKHSSLWALMRVIFNEFSSCLDTLLIDVQTQSLPDKFHELFLYKNHEFILTQHMLYSLKIVPVLSRDKFNFEEKCDKCLSLDLSLKGSLNNLNWTEKYKNKPGKNEVAVRPLSVGLNFRDIMYSLGLIPEEAVELSSIGSCLGFDVAGIVEEIGEDVQEFKPGDKVMGGAPSSLATYAVTDKNSLLRLPDSWTFNDGGTVFTVFLTAYYSLITLAGIKKGEKVLIHGAAGGVGLAAIQIANHIGAEVYATVGNIEKREFLDLHGVKNIYDSRSLYFAEALMKDTDNEGVDVVLNSLSGDAISVSFSALKPYGRFIEIGKRDIYENNLIELKPLRNNISYFCVNIEQLMLWKKDATREIILNLSKLFNDGILKPLHYSSYPASKTIDALKFLHDGKNIGKVVVDFGIDSPAPDKFLREKKKLHGYYLISGGTEGFGLATAKHLADKELEGVILLSRKGILKYDEYEYFKKRNVELKIISADVASGRDMKRVFLELDNEGINLKGIVHAATVYSDDIINNLSYDNYEKVLFTKIKGAHYLDEFSRKYCLDHFILFSSVSTFFGNLGQANYVAANGYLESLAAKRRNSGLKGNYIAWGGLSDSGVLTRNARLKKILKDKLGNTMISTKQALSVLDIIIESELPAGFSAMNYDLRQMGKSLPIINTSRFDVLSFNQKNTKEEKGNDFKEKLKSMNPEEVRAELISVVFEEVANILELKIDEINDNRPLREYGLDSLMGFDLAMSIEKRIGIAISALSMPQAPSIRSIADMLVTRLTGDNEIDVENKAIDLLKKHGEKNL